MRNFAELSAPTQSASFALTPEQELSMILCSLAIFDEEVSRNAFPKWV
jgi:hypothetical protein